MNPLGLVLALGVLGTGDGPATGLGTCLLGGPPGATVQVMSGEMGALPPVADALPRRSDGTARGADCLVEAGELPEGGVLVDVRSRLEAETVWIPDGLHEPSVQLIGSRAMFAEGTLVIFGSGTDDARLVAACNALRERRDPPVHVVRGGLRALARSGIDVAGDLHALRALDVLDPEGLHRMIASGGVRMLDLMGLSTREREAFGPMVEWKDRGDIEAGAVVSSGALFDVVLFAPGTDPDQWRKDHFTDTALPPLLYAGGAESYRSFLSESTFKAAQRVRTAPMRCAG